VDVILKHNAYLEGPGMVDALVRYYTSGWSVPKRLDGMTRDQLKELSLMLGMRSLILASVLPFEKCHRVELLEGLLQELQQLLNAWPTAAGEQGQDPHALFPPLQLDAWWDTWKVTVEAASSGKSLKNKNKQRLAVPA